MTPWRSSVALLLLVAVSGGSGRADTPLAAPSPDAPSSADQRAAVPSPLPDLSEAEREWFARGLAELNQLWTVAPSAFGRWGRGPTSNAESCTDCHDNGGRGRLPERADEPLRSMLVRLSIMRNGAPVAHPIYGDQLQTLGVLGKVPAEGEAYIGWTEHWVTLSGGEVVYLRAPRLSFRHLAFGPIADDAMTSLRLAPPLWGLGLLEAVPEAALREVAARQREHGIAGRPNRVADLESGGVRSGRFGLKASQPTLRQQIAHAYHADLGVTSTLFPLENCPAAQVACAKMPVPPRPELQVDQLDAIEFYVRVLAPPPVGNTDPEQRQRGQQLFRQAQCALCHYPDLRTAEAPLPALAHQTIHAYTDLLLHDMGEGLADGRPEFEAGPRDWRTAPLWGLAASGPGNGGLALLHDGRARSVAEAILWHGGEGRAARDAFARMPRADREALVAFVLSL